MANPLQNLPSHIERPFVRPFQPVPIQTKEGQTMALLRDPVSLGGQSMIVPPQVLGLLAQFRGEETLSEIFEQLKVPVEAHEQLVQMVQKLDELGYLWGPVSEALEKKKMDEIRARGAFPVPEDARKPEVAQQLKAFVTEQLSKAEDPEFERPVVGIVAPHLDYGRGGGNYGAAYKCLQTGASERPARVVVLGTNHFGIGDGVVMSEFGFETPFGTARPDPQVLERLRDAFGEKLFKDQLDFAGEHSIALHLPWIQHLYGDVPVIAALVPDPVVGLLEDDGARVGTKEFAAALRTVLEQAGGRTVFVSSADLSHKGPQFGDKDKVDPAQRNAIEQYDREMLGEFLAGADPFLTYFEGHGNPNRWCSVGNMYAMLVAAPHVEREMVKYDQAVDPQGVVLVSSAALALLGG